MTVLTDGRPRSTSRATEHDLEASLDACYHEACYAHRIGKRRDMT
jgi:hypothetical protein